MHFDVLTTKPPLPKKTISSRSYKSLNLEVFKQDIVASDLSSFESNIPNKLVISFNSVLTSILDKHVPVKTRSITIRPLSPWYSEDVQHLRREKKKSERKWRQTRLTVHKEIFCNNRNILTHHIKLAKKEFIQNKISNSSQSQKSLFKCVDDLFYKSKKVILPSDVPGDELADKFCQFLL